MKKKLTKVLTTVLTITLLTQSISHIAKATSNGTSGSANSPGSVTSGKDVDVESTRTAAMGYAITINNKRLNTGELDNTYSVLPGFKKSLSTEEKTKIILNHDSKASGKEELTKAQARGSNVLYSTYLGSTGIAKKEKTVWCIANVPGSNANNRSMSYSKTITGASGKTWPKKSLVTEYQKNVLSWDMTKAKVQLPKPCKGKLFSTALRDEVKKGKSMKDAFKIAKESIGNETAQVKWAKEVMKYLINGTVKTGANVSGYGPAILLDTDNVTQRIITRGTQTAANYNGEDAGILKQAWNIELMYAIAVLAGKDALESVDKYIRYCDNPDDFDLYTKDIPVIEVQPLFLIPTTLGKNAVVCTAAQAVNRMNGVSPDATGNQPDYFRNKSHLNKKMQTVMEAALKDSDPGTNYAMHGVSQYGFPYLQAASLLQQKASNRKPPTAQKGYTVTPIITGRYYASSAASKKTLFSGYPGSYGGLDALAHWYNVATVKYKVSGSGDKVTYTPLTDATSIMTDSIQQTGVACQYLCLAGKNSLFIRYGLHLKGEKNRQIDPSSIRSEENEITIIKPKDGEGNTGATKTDNPVLHLQINKAEDKETKEKIQTALQIIKRAGYKDSEIFIHAPVKLKAIVKTTGTIKYDGKYKTGFMKAFNHSVNTDTKTLNTDFSLSNLLHSGWHTDGSFHKGSQLIRWDDVKNILKDKDVKIAFRDAGVSKATNFTWTTKKGSRAGSIKFTYTLDGTYKGKLKNSKKSNAWYLVGLKDGKASERQYIDIDIKPTTAEVVYNVKDEPITTDGPDETPTPGGTPRPDETPPPDGDPEDPDNPSIEKKLAEPQVFAEIKDSPMFTSDKEHLQEALGSMTTDRKVYYNAGADEFLFDFRAELLSNQKAERNYSLDFSEYISQCAFDDIDEGSHVGKKAAWTGSANSSWYSDSGSAKKDAKQKVYQEMKQWYESHVGAGNGKRQWCGHTECETQEAILPPTQKYDYSVSSTEIPNGTDPETYHTEYQATATLTIDIEDHAGCGKNCKNRVNPERFKNYTKWIQKYTGIPYVAITYASVSKLEAVDGSTVEKKILQSTDGTEMNDWTVTPGNEVKTVSMLLADKGEKKKTARSGRLWYSVMTSRYDKVDWKLNEESYNGVSVDSSKKQVTKTFNDGTTEQFQIGDFKQDGTFCEYKEGDYIALEEKKENPIFQQLKKKIYDIPITIGVQSDFLLAQTSLGEAAIFNYWDDSKRGSIKTAKVDGYNIDQNEQTIEWTKGTVDVSKLWNDKTSVITEKNRLQGDALTCKAWKQEEMPHLWYRGSPIDEKKKFSYQVENKLVARNYATGEGQYIATLYDTHHKNGNEALKIPEYIAGGKASELEEYKVKENQLELEKEYKGQDYQYADHKKYNFLSQAQLKDRTATGLSKDFTFYGSEIYNLSKVFSRAADSTGFKRTEQEVFDTLAEQKAEKMLPLNGVHEVESRGRYRTILSYQYEDEASKKAEGDKAQKDYNLIATSKYIRDDQRIEEDSTNNYQCNPILIHDPVSASEVSIEHSKDYPRNQIIGWSRDTISRGDAVQTVTNKKLKKQSQEFLTNGNFSTLIPGTSFVQHFKISNSLPGSKAGTLKPYGEGEGAVLSLAISPGVTDPEIIKNEVTIEQVANGASSGAKYVYQVNVLDVYQAEAFMELVYGDNEKSQKLEKGENTLVIDSMPADIEKVYVRIRIKTTPELLAGCEEGRVPKAILKNMSFVRETEDTYLEKFIYTTTYGSASDIVDPGQPAERIDLTSSHTFVSPSMANMYIHATGAAGSSGVGGAGASVGGHILLQKDDALMFKFANNGGRGFSSLHTGGNSVEVYKVTGGGVPEFSDLLLVAAGGGANGPYQGGDAGYPIGFDGESYEGGDPVSYLPTEKPETTTGSAIGGESEEERPDKAPPSLGGKGGLAGIPSAFIEMFGESTEEDNGGGGGAGVHGGKAGESNVLIGKGAGGGGGSCYVDTERMTNIETEERGTNTDPKCYAYYIIPERLPIFGDSAYFDSSLISIPNAPDDWYETTSKEYTSTSPVKDVDGNKIDVTMNLYVDMDFTLVYPNVGDYYQTATQSPARFLQSDLWSKTNGVKNKEHPQIYTDSMETTKWLKSKYVVFGFDVIYDGIYYYKGDKIHLPIVDESGKALQRYEMHIPLSAKENMASDNPFDEDGVSGALQVYSIALNARNQSAAENETNECYSTITLGDDFGGDKVDEEDSEPAEGEADPEVPEYEDTGDLGEDISNKIEVSGPPSDFDEMGDASDALPPPSFEEEERDDALVHGDWGYTGLSDKKAYNRAEELASILSEKEKQLCEVYTQSLPAILFTESEKTADSQEMDSYHFDGVPIYNYQKNSDLVAEHTATKISSVPVIGRIGNFMIEDTGDWRYSNLFKKRVDSGWLVEGLVPNVDTTKPNNILGDDVDIFGRALFGEADGLPTTAGETIASEWLGSSRLQEAWKYDADGGYINRAASNWNALLPDRNLDTYGSIPTARNDIINAPIMPVKNNITGLQKEYMRIGYNVYADIQTIGQYKKLEISPKYYVAKNTASGVITRPVDLYYKETTSNSYQLLNRFDTNIEEGVPSWSDSSIFVNLAKEYKRRNISEQEKYITVNYKLGDSFNTFPNYNKWIGTPQYIFLDYNTRTYVGRDEKYGTQNNKEYREDIQEPTYVDAQRWHFTLQLPTSTIMVDKNTKPGRQDIEGEQTDVNKYVGNGWYLLCAAEVVATQELELWQLEWKGDQPQDIYLPKCPNETEAPKNDTPATKVEISREEIPWNIITVFETKDTAKGDLDVYGTH